MVRNTSRYVVAIGVGAAVTFGLLFIMQYMIASGQNAIDGGGGYRIVDFIRVDREEVVEVKKEKPDPPPEPEVQPDLPEPLMSTFETAVRITMVAPPVTMNTGIGGIGFAVTDGEYLPIYKPEPIYPQRALQRGEEGWVIVEYTVTVDGSTRDVTAPESSSPVFTRAAIESAERYKYKPRIIDATPVEVRGVRTRIEFHLEE